MLRKATFIGVTAFWLVMNVLLWRSEFAGRGDGGAAAPVSLVWQKILTSPDDSGLAVHLNKRRVGYIRWVPNIGDEAGTGKTANENSDIEGRIKKTTGYTIHTDGNFILPDHGLRFRFEFDAAFGADYRWREWMLKSIQRPNAWTIAANRDGQKIDVTLGEGRRASRQSFRFADLRNTERLLSEVGLTAVPGLTELFANFGGTQTNASPLSLQLEWEARQDWMQMGHSRVRIYRLSAHLFDKYEVVILVSRVGEILRVELPGELALVNEALITL